MGTNFNETMDDIYYRISVAFKQHSKSVKKLKEGNTYYSSSKYHK